jgi:hypothetical protein
MITRIIAALSPIPLVTLVSCGQENESYKNRMTATNDTRSADKAVTVTATDTLPSTATALWLSPKAMTPLAFLEAMKKGADNALGVVTMTDDFPDDWIRKVDITGLLKLIDSQEKCSCFMNPLSSSIPKRNATVGGYATALVEAYKEKRRVSFGLHSCPTADKQKAHALHKWWATQKK